MLPMNAMTKLRAILTLLAALSLAGALTACGEDSDSGDKDTDNNPTTQARDYSLRLAPSCDALTQQIIDVTTEQALQYRYNGWRNVMAGGDGGPTSSPPSNDSSGGPEAAPTDFTTTNVQEAGVDELDIVKTDGSFIYTVRNNELVVLKSWPATEVGEVSRLRVYENSNNEGRPDGLPQNYASGWARGLFLKGDRVAIISDIYEYTYDAQGNYVPTQSFYGTRVTLVDVTDRTQPRLLSTPRRRGLLQRRPHDRRRRVRRHQRQRRAAPWPRHLVDWLARGHWPARHQL